MKLLYKPLILCGAALLSLKAPAQLVSAYAFSQFQGVYTAVSGGTVFGTTSNDSQYFADPANSAGGTNAAAQSGQGLPIGFNFVYNNVTYDRFGINANGWIGLGQSTLTPNPVNLNTNDEYNVIGATSTAPADLQCRISGLDLDLYANGTGVLRAETIGAAPNRTLVVQWENYDDYYNEDASLSFQIRLCETSNKVQVMYGTFAATWSSSGQVGLRGQAATNYNIRRVQNSGSWAASTAGTNNGQSCNFSSTLFPASGQTFEWVAPVSCGGTPVAANALANHINICPNVNVNLSLSTSYTGSLGISYQWQSSSTGIGGVYSNITTGTGSGTTAAIPSGSLTATMAFRAVITCTAGPSSYTSAAIEVTVGLPANSSAVSNRPLVCPGTNAALSLAPAYAGGVSYQWQQSATGVAGSFTNVPTGGATAGYNATNLTAQIYYHAIVSCTASPTYSIVSAPVTVSVAQTVTNTVPYLETFEGISFNNDLPNCQWTASNIDDETYTYISAGSYNRINHTPGGSKFASFGDGADDEFFTNGILLYAGVVYRGSVWYIADQYGEFTNISIGVNSVQSAAGMTVIASDNAPNNTAYNQLMGTFTVAATGLYYIGIHGEDADYSGEYLSFDDVAVDVACDLSPVDFALNAPAAICIGDNATLEASGGTGILSPAAYQWNTGATTSSITTSPTSAQVYSVSATSTVGCITTKTISIGVNPLPVLSVFAVPASVCPGKPVSMAALGGAVSYTWSTGDHAAVISQSPAITTDYTLEGTDVNGCRSSVVQKVIVNDLPVIVAVSSASMICNGESASLQATGADAYTWNSGSTFLVGTPVSVAPAVNTTYSITGTDVNGCIGTITFEQKVSACTGFATLQASVLQAAVYPNPSNGLFNVTLANGLSKQFAVSDVTGRVVAVQATDADMATLDVRHLADGIYYVRIVSGGQSDVIKIIKH